MKRFSGLFINQFTDLNGVQLGDEVVKKVLKEQPRVPVTIDFTGNPIGFTLSYIQTGSVIQCEFVIDETRHPLLEMAYVVPRFENVEYHLDGRTKIVDAGDLVEATITLLPSNPKMTMIKEIK